MFFWSLSNLQWGLCVTLKFNWSSFQLHLKPLHLTHTLHTHTPHTHTLPLPTHISLSHFFHVHTLSLTDTHIHVCTLSISFPFKLQPHFQELKKFNSPIWMYSQPSLFKFIRFVEKKFLIRTDSRGNFINTTISYWILPFEVLISWAFDIR